MLCCVPRCTDPIVESVNADRQRKKFNMRKYANICQENMRTSCQLLDCFRQAKRPQTEERPRRERFVSLMRFDPAFNFQDWLKCRGVSIFSGEHLANICEHLRTFRFFGISPRDFNQSWKLNAGSNRIIEADRSLVDHFLVWGRFERK